MYDDDDDDDQRQALGQPIFGHPYVEDDCGPGVSFSLSFFFLLYRRDIFFFFLSSSFLISFVQYAVYDHVLSNHANIIF